MPAKRKFVYINTDLANTIQAIRISIQRSISLHRQFDDLMESIIDSYNKYDMQIDDIDELMMVIIDLKTDTHKRFMAERTNQMPNIHKLLD